MPIVNNIYPHFHLSNRRQMR